MFENRLENMKITLNSEEIKKLIPHRYPFLLIDRVLDIKNNESIIAMKNLSVNEEIFQGHFPGHPVIPGVLTIEMCAQAASILCSYSDIAVREKKTNEKIDVLGSNNLLTDQFVFYLTTVDKTKFRIPMTPGDQLVIYVSIVQKSSRMWKFNGRVLIDDKETSVETEFSAFIKSKVEGTRQS